MKLWDEHLNQQIYLGGNDFIKRCKNMPGGAMSIRQYQPLPATTSAKPSSAQVSASHRLAAATRTFFANDVKTHRLPLKGLACTARLQRKVNPRAAQRVTTMELGLIPAAIVGGAKGVNTPVLALML